MINKLYISHDPEDQVLAEELSEALWRVGLDSYVSMHRRCKGISRAEGVAYGIRNSDCFVPLLTTNGVLSRTVNQEMGFARGLERLIIPMMEEGEELPFMVSHLQPVLFRPGEFEDAVGVLIKALRFLTRLEWLKVRCVVCGEEMTQYLTPQEEVDRALFRGTSLETICSYCESRLSLDPRTFKPMYR